MPVCKKIRGQRRKVCIGDLDRLIDIKDRNIQEPGNIDDSNRYYFTEAFTEGVNPQAWAMRISVDGKTIFDGQNIEQVVTDEFYIRYDANITAEFWIEDDGDRFDILNVENLDGRKEFMKLVCTDRGLNTNSNTGV